MAAAEDLIGSWRMLSWRRRLTATGREEDVLGADPIGYIAYHADGRMMATVFRRDRPSPEPDGWTMGEKAGLFDAMLAYVASYTVEGNQVIHHVEAAWNPAWAGDLSRPFVLEGRHLTISGAPGFDPVTGDDVEFSMAFEKV